MEFPDVPLSTCISSHAQLAGYFKIKDPKKLSGASDSTWATARRHHHSTGGVVFFFTGGAVYYRARTHPTVAQSSTEAKLGFMTDAGKAALYLRSILEELCLEQCLATKIDVDNRAGRQLTNAQQPTRRIRHIDMKDFCILQWTEEERIIYQDVSSALNVSDSLSKPTGCTKFYEHTDVMMGRRKPNYVKSTNAFLPSFSTCNFLPPIPLDFEATSVGG